jgi:uncharacterized protein YigA (DUF484 family)
MAASETAVAPLSDEQVSAYLRANPDFLQRQPDLALHLAAPPREGGDGVADLQHFMNARLRREVEELRHCSEYLIETQRANMSLQTRIHRAALATLATASMEELVQVLGDMVDLFEVDVITLCLETADEVLPELAAAGVMRIARGSCAEVFGDRDVLLRAAASGDAAVFGAAAPLVRSYAFARLIPGARRPQGFLALGSRNDQFFHSGQSTELLGFFTRVVEYAIQRWIP